MNQTIGKFFREGAFGIGKVWGGVFAILIPGGLVAYCNHLVFPDSSYIAIGMVATTIGIAVLFTVASAYASGSTRRLVLISHFVLCLVLSINLAGHWILAREKSGAEQATAERRAEEDRQEERRKSQVNDTLALLDKARDLEDAARRRLDAEGNRDYWARRLGRQAGQGSAVTTAGAGLSAEEMKAAIAASAPSATAAIVAAPKLTVEQVMEKWSDRLMWMAILDLLSSIVAFGLCCLKWEWDVDGDGVPDHLQGGSRRRWRWPWQAAPGK